MNKIGDAAQRGFKFFRCFSGNAGAKTARRHIDKTGFIIDPAISISIAFPAIASFSALSSASGIPALVAKSLAVPSGKRPSAGYAVADLDERGRHFINGTVSAAGNHRFNAQSTGFINVTLRVAFSQVTRT